MNIPPDALQKLADRMRCGASPHEVRKTLEASLLPMVRRALRCGGGQPPLVQWVETNLPRVQAGQDRTRPVDPERAAPPLARLLCDVLLSPRPVRPAPAGAETVVGG